MTGRIGLFLVGIVLLVPIGFGIALFAPARFPSGTPTPVTLTVEEGDTAVSLAKDLDRQGIVTSSLLYRIALKLHPGSETIQVGDYAFPNALSAWSAVGALTGTRYLESEVSVTFPEGFTSEQMGERLEAAGIVSKAAFLAVVENPSTTVRAKVSGLPSGASLEGYLFPDTYRFRKNTDAADVVAKLLDNFAAKRADLPAPSGSAKGVTFHQAVILASIVEDEVRTAKDRELAADLFWRRIDLGIALQSDATVNFVTGKGLASPTLDDTRVESLYNTYLHPGLPPGPIGNPGAVSLSAALNPTPNAYLYFLTKSDGTTVFSKTYEEHLANKAKYL